MRRFNELAERLERRGIRVVALSKDSVEDAATHRSRDGLERITLLADPELEVIRRYGVEHHKSIGTKTTRFHLFGVPLSYTMSFQAMAIPTTLLVDERGVVRWIDQSEDYRIRSDNEEVFGAVDEVFPEAQGKTS